MALTEGQNTQLEELFKTKLREQYNKGIQVGILTVSQVVYDKLNDSSKPLMNRIEEVKRFCKIPQDITDKYNEIQNNKEEQQEVRKIHH